MHRRSQVKRIADLESNHQSSLERNSLKKLKCFEFAAWSCKIELYVSVLCCVAALQLATHGPSFKKKQHAVEIQVKFSDS